MKRAEKTSTPAPSRLYLLDAHHRFVIAAVIAVAAFFAGGDAVISMRLLIGWSAFALAGTVLAWIVLFVGDPYVARRTAKLQDSNATLLFGIVISAATVSLFAVGLLLGSAKSLPPLQLGEHVTVSVFSIVCSWMLVHTIFALRYAHLYYFNARDQERHLASGGLEFPGKESPAYMDFAYFSFVIGMTCQVSDVQISAPRFRRLALVHGLISFCFNTAILAVFVNIVASLL
jgi:uncharacterized membrane protein